MDRRTKNDLRAAVAVRSLLLMELGLWAQKLEQGHRLILERLATGLLDATEDLAQNDGATELMREALEEFGVLSWSDEEAKS